jgi:hypothetical protein
LRYALTNQINKFLSILSLGDDSLATKWVANGTVAQKTVRGWALARGVVNSEPYS